MKIENHRLVKEAGGFPEIRFERSPNFGGALAQRHLMIHATQGALIGTVSWFKQRSGLSTHLIISDDGDEIVQMVPFNRRGVHAHEYNRDSIGIELEYPGPLLQSRSILYRWIDRFDARRRVETAAQNDGRVRTWTFFQAPQLETLADVCRLLMDHYGIESVLRHEAVNPGKIDPGPLFPMNTFLEKLSGMRGTLTEETSRLIHIRTGPGMEFPPVLDGALPAGTPVAVVDERGGWVLVEVMAEINGSAWHMGWIDGQYVRVSRFVPVVKGHRLAAQDGALARYIEPAPGNYDPRGQIKAHKYLIMHVTGGSSMQGTINWFRNPASGVSAHLVIGRDGRVVQFLPFDKVAFHSGFSYWEGDENLNHLSIGIEIDNMATLRGGPGKYTFKRRPVEDSRVQEATHWKHSRPKGWERFPDIQLEVAFEIAKALIETYGITEVLGHDEVNLRERLDPGPLFPLQDWRARLFPGDVHPKIRIMRVDVETPVYEHIGQNTPASNPPLLGVLGARSRLAIRDELGDWSLVRVVLPSRDTKNKKRFKNRFGWIEKRHIRLFGGATRNMQAVDFYTHQIGSKGGPPLLQKTTLPRGVAVRVQVERPQAGWTLIASIGPVGRARWLEGWVPSEALVPDADFVSVVDADLDSGAGP